MTGSLWIEGPEDKPLQANFKPFESHYQATTRLEQEGEYRISVRFDVDGTPGQTQAFPFRYRRKPPQEPQEQHHPH